MPQVPYSNNVVPLRPQLPEVEDKYLAMAAAMMHQEGKFEKPLSALERLKLNEKEMESQQAIPKDETKPLPAKPTTVGA